MCESEFKGHDLIPRVIVVGGALAGIVGFGSYLRSGTSDTQTLRQPKKLVEQVAPAAQLTATNTVGIRVPNVSSANAVQPEQRNLSSAPVTQKPKAEVEVPYYYCGAETKKGKPCSRRVKGNLRCYQHVGMPAMVSAEKLRIN
ncbi:MAG: hypothetical protein ABIO54_03400 [Pyrinomonadaceae bacterium]